MNNNETVIITAQNIGDMLLFADDVLEAMDMNAMKYDENGVFILSKYENYDDAMREITGNMQNAAGYSFLYELYRDESYRLDEVHSVCADDVLNILPQELKKRSVFSGMALSLMIVSYLRISRIDTLVSCSL